MTGYKTTLFEVSCDEERLSLRPSRRSLAVLFALPPFFAALGFAFCNAASSLMDCVAALVSFVCILVLIGLSARVRAPFVFDRRAGELRRGNRVLCSLDRIARVEMRETCVGDIIAYEMGFARTDDSERAFRFLAGVVSSQPCGRDMERIAHTVASFTGLDVLDARGAPVASDAILLRPAVGVSAADSRTLLRASARE